MILRQARVFVTAIVVGLVPLGTVCSADDSTLSDGDSSSNDAAVTSTTVAEMTNSCPTDGCKISISGAKRSGDELVMSFVANFDPDVSKNHIHVYWDRFTPEQVSNDAETTHSVVQGQWVPTDEEEAFITEAGVAMAIREGATQVCVTAGDRDHNVIDPAVSSCRDVSDLL